MLPSVQFDTACKPRDFFARYGDSNADGYDRFIKAVRERISILGLMHGDMSRRALRRRHARARLTR